MSYTPPHSQAGAGTAASGLDFYDYSAGRLGSADLHLRSPGELTDGGGAGLDGEADHVARDWRDYGKDYEKDYSTNKDYTDLYGKDYSKEYEGYGKEYEGYRKESSYRKEDSSYGYRKESYEQVGSEYSKPDYPPSDRHDYGKKLYSPDFPDFSDYSAEAYAAAKQITTKKVPTASESAAEVARKAYEAAYIASLRQSGLPMDTLTGVDALDPLTDPLSADGIAAEYSLDPASYSEYGGYLEHLRPKTPGLPASSSKSAALSARKTASLTPGGASSYYGSPYDPFTPDLTNSHGLESPAPARHLHASGGSLRGSLGGPTPRAAGAPPRATPPPKFPKELLATPAAAHPFPKELLTTPHPANALIDDLDYEAELAKLNHRKAVSDALKKKALSSGLTTGGLSSTGLLSTPTPGGTSSLTGGSSSGKAHTDKSLGLSLGLGLSSGGAAGASGAPTRPSAEHLDHLKHLYSAHSATAGSESQAQAQAAQAAAAYFALNPHAGTAQSAHLAALNPHAGQPAHLAPPGLSGTPVAAAGKASLLHDPVTAAAAAAAAASAEAHLYPGGAAASAEAHLYPGGNYHAAAKGHAAAHAHGHSAVGKHSHSGWNPTADAEKSAYEKPYHGYGKGYGADAVQKGGKNQIQKGSYHKNTDYSKSEVSGGASSSTAYPGSYGDYPSGNKGHGKSHQPRAYTNKSNSGYTNTAMTTKSNNKGNNSGYNASNNSYNSFNKATGSAAAAAGYSAAGYSSGEKGGKGDGEDSHSLSLSGLNGNISAMNLMSNIQLLSEKHLRKSIAVVDSLHYGASHHGGVSILSQVEVVSKVGPAVQEQRLREENALRLKEEQKLRELQGKGGSTEAHSQQMKSLQELRTLNNRVISHHPNTCNQNSVRADRSHLADDPSLRRKLSEASVYVSAGGSAVLSMTRTEVTLASPQFLPGMLILAVKVTDQDGQFVHTRSGRKSSISPSGSTIITEEVVEQDDEDAAEAETGAATAGSVVPGIAGTTTSVVETISKASEQTTSDQTATKTSETETAQTLSPEPKKSAITTIGEADEAQSFFPTPSTDADDEGDANREGTSSPGESGSSSTEASPDLEQAKKAEAKTAQAEAKTAAATPAAPTRPKFHLNDPARFVESDDCFIVVQSIASYSKDHYDYGDILRVRTTPNTGSNTKGTESVTTIIKVIRSMIIGLRPGSVSIGCHAHSLEATEEVSESESESEVEGEEKDGAEENGEEGNGAEEENGAEKSEESEKNSEEEVTNIGEKTETAAKTEETKTETQNEKAKKAKTKTEKTQKAKTKKTRVVSVNPARGCIEAVRDRHERATAQGLLAEDLEEVEDKLQEEEKRRKEDEDTERVKLEREKREEQARRIAAGEEIPEDEIVPEASHMSPNVPQELLDAEAAAEAEALEAEALEEGGDADATAIKSKKKKAKRSRKNSKDLLNLKGASGTPSPSVAYCDYRGEGKVDYRGLFPDHVLCLKGARNRFLDVTFLSGKWHNRSVYVSTHDAPRTVLEAFLSYWNTELGVKTNTSWLELRFDGLKDCLLDGPDGDKKELENGNADGTAAEETEELTEEAREQARIDRERRREGDMRQCLKLLQLRRKISGLLWKRSVHEAAAEQFSLRSAREQQSKAEQNAKRRKEESERQARKERGEQTAADVEAEKTKEANKEKEKKAKIEGNSEGGEGEENGEEEESAENPDDADDQEKENADEEEGEEDADVPASPKSTKPAEEGAEDEENDCEKSPKTVKNGEHGEASPSSKTEGGKTEGGRTEGGKTDTGKTDSGKTEKTVRDGCGEAPEGSAAHTNNPAYSRLSDDLIDCALEAKLGLRNELMWGVDSHINSLPSGKEYGLNRSVQEILGEEWESEAETGSSYWKYNQISDHMVLLGTYKHDALLDKSFFLVKGIVQREYDSHTGKLVRELREVFNFSSSNNSNSGSGSTGGSNGVSDGPRHGIDVVTDVNGRTQIIHSVDHSGRGATGEEEELEELILETPASVKGPGSWRLDEPTFNLSYSAYDKVFRVPLLRTSSKHFSFKWKESRLERESRRQRARIDLLRAGKDPALLSGLAGHGHGMGGMGGMSHGGHGHSGGGTHHYNNYQNSMAGTNSMMGMNNMAGMGMQGMNQMGAMTGMGNMMGNMGNMANMGQMGMANMANMAGNMTGMNPMMMMNMGMNMMGMQNMNMMGQMGANMGQMGQSDYCGSASYYRGAAGYGAGASGYGAGNNWSTGSSKGAGSKKGSNAIENKTAAAAGAATTPASSTAGSTAGFATNTGTAINSKANKGSSTTGSSLNPYSTSYDPTYEAAYAAAAAYTNDWSMGTTDYSGLYTGTGTGGTWDTSKRFGY